MTISVLERDKQYLIYCRKIIYNKKKIYEKKIESLKKELNNNLKEWNKRLNFYESKIKKKIEDINNEKENQYLIEEINSLDL